MHTGAIVYYSSDPKNLYEVSGMPGEALYDSRGFTSADLGCTIKEVGTIECANSWLWAFQSSLTLVNMTNPSWEV